METPYTGRAVINEFYDGVDIIIPAKKNWFVMAIICAWLFGMLYFVIFVFTLLQGPGAVAARHGIYIIFSLFLIPVVAAVSRLWWNIAGKELIHVSQGVLTINRKGALFKRTKSYELAHCTNFRAVEVEMPIYHYNTRTAAMLRKKPNPGTIKFDYDVVDTIQFGDWLPEAEARYILERLRAKKLIG
jgi:drug/metabolite transporter superfamily protein YnfA